MALGSGIDFESEYTYFSKYSTPGIKGKRFWNALAQGILYFIPMFGMCVEIIHQMYHTSSFGLISFHLSLSVPVIATLIMGILIISATVMSVVKGLEQHEKLAKASLKENELNYNNYMLQALKQVYLEHEIDFPEGYDKPLYDEDYLHTLSWFSHFKTTITLSAHTIFGNFAWASSLSSLIGLNLFSTALVLGPLSPFILMWLFMVLNVGFVVWLHGATESKYELHHGIQQCKLVEVKSQILVLRTDINIRKSLHDVRNRNFIESLIENCLLDPGNRDIVPFNPQTSYYGNLSASQVNQQSLMASQSRTQPAQSTRFMHPSHCGRGGSSAAQQVEFDQEDQDSEVGIDTVVDSQFNNTNNQRRSGLLGR